MSKIKIKNFGPIKEGMPDYDGLIDIKNVTVFIGNQGSGKSTVAKAISTLSWIEKSLNRGETEKEITPSSFEKFFEYQRINNYFSKNTYIEFKGEKFHILYDKAKKSVIIKEIFGENYIVPQIIYIPAERSFLSTISDVYNVKGLPDNVFTFAEELRKAQKELNGEKLKLPIGNFKYEYDEKKDSSFISGPDYKINLIEASSGLQSFIPLYLVSKNLSDAISENQEKFKRNLSVEQALRLEAEIMILMNDSSLNETERNKKVTEVKSKYFNKCFQNIVEEPEQNLFPSSQQQMLYSLLEFNNFGKGNKLIMTTHSPYLINYLTLAVKAGNVYNSLKEKGFKSRDPEFSQTNEIVPISSTVDPNDLAIYELNEKNGTINLLGNYDGIPSDKNYLNQSIAKGNQLFDTLMEIEEEYES